MPYKRNRKDSEKSTEEENISTGADGTCSSSSSGSQVDDNESTWQRACCMPAGCLFDKNVNLAEPYKVAKVICNNEGCPTSTYMHMECFLKWEDGLLTHLKSHGRARSWSEKQRRQNLWTKRGYDLTYKACICKCGKGHLKKDLDWNPQKALTSVEGDNQDVGAGAKKKNRKKHKDLPTLGNKIVQPMPRSKSKPIPSGNRENRIRHNSTSSSVSIDQGYSSSSPATTEISGTSGTFMFSPPHTRSGSNALSRYLYGHVTSPLPEVPDDSQFEASERPTEFPTRFPLSTSSEESQYSHTLTPQLSNFSKAYNRPNQFHGMTSSPTQEPNHYGSVEEIRQLMHTIDMANSPVVGQTHGRRRMLSESALMDHKDMFATPRALHIVNMHAVDPHQWYLQQQQQQSEHEAALRQQLEPRKQELQQQDWMLRQTSRETPTNTPTAFPHEFINNLKKNHVAQQHDGQNVMKMISDDEDHERVIKVPNESCDQNGRHTLTEIRIVPMKTTTFAHRQDFSVFQEVLPACNINPYHIKMEGEGYGSDDLRNFILSKLSLAKCSQMKCVLCSHQLPIYDHFPLIDGVMYISPEASSDEPDHVQLPIEGKNWFVHGVCIRCMEGIHNIVCRSCKSRWDGSFHQLGSLYMYDIFAASPCCPQRISCKNCGSPILDGRSGPKYFSDYSNKISCPRCHVNDYHFVKSVKSFQLEGLVFS